MTVSDFLFGNFAAVALLDFSVDAKIILVKSDEGKVELLLGAKTFEQFQIPLRESIHDLLLVWLFLFSLGIALLQQIYAVERVVVPSGGCVYLDLSKVEQLFSPEGVIDDGDVLNDGAHFIS